MQTIGILLTNIGKMQRGAPLTDKDREPWLRALNGAVRNWIADKRDVLLACSALRERYRNALCEGLPDRESVRFVYLKGTYEEIERRLSVRAGALHAGIAVKKSVCGFRRAGLFR